jgi:hypothetical protein
VGTTPRWGLALLLLAILAVQPVSAFECPLSSESIREAYFISKENFDRKQAFFRAYRHDMPLPNSGPDVGLIEVETPFACLVDAIARKPSDYHAQDAEAEYLGKRAEFRVHVEIYFTATYPKASDRSGSLGAFWNDFHVHLKQSGEIKPLSVQCAPIYDDQTLSGFSGATLDLDYDVKKIDPGGMTTIDVQTPDGQDIETTFLLNSLR